MFVPCLYLDIPTQTSSYMLQTAQARYLQVLHAIKKRIITGFKPRILCIPASCLNHYATSINAGMQHLQYVYIFYQDAGVALLVLNPPPPPARDVTCQFIKTDSFNAWSARVATTTEGHRDWAWQQPS